MTQPETSHTVGLALEGGGYRGMYTAGVLDVWMEHCLLYTSPSPRDA